MLTVIEKAFLDTRKAFALVDAAEDTLEKLYPERWQLPTAEKLDGLIAVLKEKLEDIEVDLKLLDAKQK